MIRYRDFAIQTGALAGITLAAGCGAVSIDGDWKGTALITGYGDTFELPFSWDGTTTYEGWFGTATSEFETYTMDASLVVDGDTATLSRTVHKVYVYTYDFGEESEEEPTVLDVERSVNLTYSGAITRISDREFDIVMPLTGDDSELLIDDQLQPPAEGNGMTSRSAVLECGTDGDELLCDAGGELLVFARDGE